MGGRLDLPVFLIGGGADGQPIGAHPRDPRIAPGAEDDGEPARLDLVGSDIHALIAFDVDVPHRQADMHHGRILKATAKADGMAMFARAVAGLHLASIREGREEDL